MPKIHEIVDNVAAQISNDSIGEVWFIKVDLKTNQLALDNFTVNQCNFSIVGGNITGIYQFLTGFYGLGDTPNEFQRVMDSTVGTIPFTNCYLDDILIASKGSFSDHKKLFSKSYQLKTITIFPLNGQNANSFKKKSNGSDSKSQIL